MQSLSATEFARNFGRRNQDVQTDTIEVTSYGRPIGYYLSPREYRELRTQSADEAAAPITDYDEYVKHRKALEAQIASLTYISIRGTVMGKADQIRALAKRCGVARVRLFGSVARGEDGPDSDIDFLIDYEDGQFSLANHGTIIEELENLFDRKIDVVETKRLHPAVARNATKEAVDL